MRPWFHLNFPRGGDTLPGNVGVTAKHFRPAAPGRLPIRPPGGLAPNRPLSWPGKRGYSSRSQPLLFCHCITFGKRCQGPTSENEVPSRAFYHLRFWFFGRGFVGAGFCPRPFSRKGQVSTGRLGSRIKSAERTLPETAQTRRGFPKQKWMVFPNFAWKCMKKVRQKPLLLASCQLRYRPAVGKIEEHKCEMKSEALYGSNCDF